MTRVRFRHHTGLAIAGLVAMIGAIPLATVRWYLTPILLIPAAVAVWGWRAGTDADESGVTLEVGGDRHGYAYPELGAGRVQVEFGRLDDIDDDIDDHVDDDMDDDAEEDGE